MSNNISSIEPIVLVHGGAGDIPDSRNDGKLNGCIKSAEAGYAQLAAGRTALDAVEAAVRYMEEDDYFNAGYGSVLTIDGNVELEASIMDGRNLHGGCVTGIKDILYPITVARRVMDKTNHNFLGGDGAMEFARNEGFEILKPPGQLVTPYALEALDEYKAELATGRDMTYAKTEIGHNENEILRDIGEVGTVGAVAIDAHGNIAAATSTGGITGKLHGRVGDTPLLGSGTYADNFVGGVSTTGHGETIMRFNVAQTIIKRMEFLKENAQTATTTSLEDMTKRLTGTAGAITISAKGEIGIHFTSEKMAWAYRKGNDIHYGIRKGEAQHKKVN